MGDFHVIIIGGGLGGLSLAQGLKKNGISCAVYEKASSKTDRLQGYRISLREFGTEALKICLPDDLYNLVGETAGITPDVPELSMLTEQLDVLLAVGLNLKSDSFAVSRIVLHRILTTGLDDIIHYGYRYERAEVLEESGRLRVHFRNGEFAEGDFLVAADGVYSAVRKQFLPREFEPVQYGTAGVAGKVFVDDPSTIDFDPVERGICIVMSTEGRGVFVAPQRYSPEAKARICELFAGVTDGVTHEAQLPPNASGEQILLLGGDQKKPLVDDARDYVFFGYVTKYSDEDFGIREIESIKDISQRGLLDAVLREMKTRKWSPKLINLVNKTEVNTVGYWPLHLSPRISTLEGRNKPANVTFLGDSIHAMPPTGGEGGNTAIRDAAQLTQRLIKLSTSEDRRAMLAKEIVAYETDMLKFSSAVVHRSLRNSGMITAEGWVYPYFIRTVLKVINFFFGLKKA